MSQFQRREVPAIQTIDLRREYRMRSKRHGTGKTIAALDDVSLAIKPGELFGLLGRNGAGKTTLIKILTTLLAPTSGQAFVDGLDVTRHVIPVRQRIAMVSGGEQSGYGILTVREQNPRRTVLLTTHYMFEADELCDRVAVINHGQIVAQGTTSELKRDLQEHARFQLELAEWIPAFVERLRATDGVVDAQAETRKGRVELRLSLSSEEVIAATMAMLSEAGGRVLTLRRIEPTLEEAFVRLVGDAVEDEQHAEVQK